MVTRSPSPITTTQPQKVQRPVYVDDYADDRLVGYPWYDSPPPTPTPPSSAILPCLPALWKREGVFAIPLLVIRD